MTVYLSEIEPISIRREVIKFGITSDVEIVFYNSSISDIGAVVIFFVAFFLALIGLVLTELFCDAVGVPRRGESWEDLRLRSEWEAKRREELAKEKEGKTE